ncbi:MAG: tetraacyldisaccharide 4'-kinase [Gammaproteobacteria bacterium]|nr:tetraacyldisaccharide 4'-kinase [Gammaproteobacteria bacterium]NNC98410.1 tetraacyldisaccharide 4'-kinase [Gammaproteobacteria bacterium]NNM13886.1 tetraacyldisaccharide 4'-kinase [Gammaproteobacteria bacterium]
MQKLEQYLLRVWYGEKNSPWFLRCLVPLYVFLLQFRKLLYRIGLIKTVKLPKPVIVVGNITVGGTGKTPVVMHLIELLREHGLKPGVISRGYGGSRSHLASVMLDTTSLASEVGDEPYMIFQKTRVPFAIGKARVAAARTLLANAPDVDVILSDDGLQHRKLGRDHEIVVLDGQRGLGNGNLIPAGPLREKKTRLHQADILLCNGEPVHDSLQNLVLQSFTLEPGVICQLNSGRQQALTALSGRSVHAFAGIGNPERFFNLLEKYEVKVTRHALGDHAAMPHKFFERHSNEIILMTEKDAVKYPDLQADNIWFVPVTLNLQSEAIDSMISSLVEPTSKQTT